VIELLTSAGALLLLDHWSKRTVELRVAGRCVPWGHLLRIRCVRKPATRHGRASSRAALVLIWLVAFASSLVLHRVDVKFQGHTALIGLGSALGGAAGNLLDIWRRHSITDFIDLGWWPVFNVADIAITGGLVLAFWPRS
jgi:signal peptidase II